MAKGRVLLAGGASIVRFHVAAEARVHGYPVWTIDALVPQMHGAERARPKYLSPDVEMWADDIRDSGFVKAALPNLDSAIHLVGLVGIGQSICRVGEVAAPIHTVGMQSPMPKRRPTLTSCYSELHKEIL